VKSIALKKPIRVGVYHKSYEGGEVLTLARKIVKTKTTVSKALKALNLLSKVIKMIYWQKCKTLQNANGFVKILFLYVYCINKNFPFSAKFCFKYFVSFC